MKCAWLTAALAISFAAHAMQAADAEPQTNRIPLVAGLTITAAISESAGDYEAIYQVQFVEKDTYGMTLAAEVPDEFGEGTVAINVPRRVTFQDHRSARIMRPRFYEGDAEIFRGTTPFFSAAIVQELRRQGTAQFTWRQVDGLFGLTIERDFVGTLTRVGAMHVTVLVNGRRERLASIHAAGRLTAEDGDVMDADVYLLDDPGNPLLLSARSGKVIRIDFPAQNPGASALEAALASERTADVYGVYFSFNSASIRPQSARVLREIAAILRKNNTWILRIDGHTDSIGGDASNLDLSRRRAAAVKAALVQQYGIAPQRLTSGGHGEGSPKDTNETVEGRARNRRVELTRL